MSTNRPRDPLSVRRRCRRTCPRQVSPLEVLSPLYPGMSRSPQGWPPESALASFQSDGGGPDSEPELTPVGRRSRRGVDGPTAAICCVVQNLQIRRRVPCSRSYDDVSLACSETTSTFVCLGRSCWTAGDWRRVACCLPSVAVRVRMLSDASFFLGEKPCRVRAWTSSSPRDLGHRVDVRFLDEWLRASEALD